MIKKYDDVLSEKLMKNVMNYFQSILTKNVWGSNLGWDQNLSLISSNILVHRISDNLLSKEICNAVENKIKINFDSENLIFTSFLYVWSSSSYITWHNDGSYPYNGTIYLNKEWDSNDGGIFLYKDESNEVKGIEPTYNSLIVNSGTEEKPHSDHCVTCIVPGTVKKRITIQWRTFLNKKQKVSYQ
tara:strand:- start:54 stop:611 length:558 start_codon:yes stop_codon:yes gene_type:complete